MKKNVWQVPKSSPYLQRSLVLDKGSFIGPSSEREMVFYGREVHKEFGIMSRTKCCWNSQRADVLFSVQQLHCPGVSSKAKDTENCRYILLRIIQQLRLFRIIVFANQLSLYGAVANMCEEFEATKIHRGNLMYWWDNQKFLWESHPITPESSIAAIWRTNQIAFTRKTKWVNSAWMQDLYMLLKWDNISWPKTLKNSSLRELDVNTLFQEVTNHHNPKDGFSETQELDPYWKSRPVICTVNMELKSESGLWVKIILNPGSENLMGQINSWLIRTTTTQKFLQIYLKNKRHIWIWWILQPNQRQKQNHKEENLLIYRASFRWMKESGLILNQENNLSLRTRFRRK